MNDTVLQSESWFIPMDIIMIIPLSICTILGVVFLFLVATHRTCWSVPMLFICNSCFVEIALSCVLLATVIYTLKQDLRKELGDIASCVFTMFIVYSLFAAEYYSYLLTALYRYISIVYPNHRFWQSMRCQLCLIISKWIFSIAFGLSVYLTNNIVYNINNQICQAPLGLSVILMYNAVVIYVIPNMGIILVYMLLTRYVHRMSARTTVSNRLFHARRELKLIQRTFILACTLICLGIPYLIFVLISFATEPPKYHFRIAYFFIDFSILIVMILRYYFTQPVKDIIRRVLPPTNIVASTRAIARTTA